MWTFVESMTQYVSPNNYNSWPQYYKTLSGVLVEKEFIT